MHVYMCMHTCTYGLYGMYGRFWPIERTANPLGHGRFWPIEITADPLGKFCPHTLPRTLCPGAGGGWISPTQPPPFERHPHPAGGEGIATAKVAPSGLGQSQVVEPESARTRPGSRDTHGQGLLERAQVWSVMRRVRVTLPLHYRYITVTLPLHHGYVTRILGARRGVLVAVAAVKTRRRLARTLGRVRGAGTGLEPSLGHGRSGSLQWLPARVMFDLPRWHTQRCGRCPNSRDLFGQRRSTS